VTEPQPGEPDVEALSAQLRRWLEQTRTGTIGDLVDLMDEKSFAVVLMVLMLPSALPIPTGGVTHVLELAAALVALQMTVGRRELWLPRWIARRGLGPMTSPKAVDTIVRRVQWFERFARPRFARALDARVTDSLLGLLLLVFVAGAFVAVPFSGLDTLPSLGVVVVCLGILFGDTVIVVVGAALGAIGIALVVLLGSLVWSLF
jgi:hypothetical protein